MEKVIFDWVEKSHFQSLVCYAGVIYKTKQRSCGWSVIKDVALRIHVKHGSDKVCGWGSFISYMVIDIRVKEKMWSEAANAADGQFF